MLLQIDPHEPEPWLVARAAEVLRGGAVAAVPTDTVYALACCMTHPKAVERIYALKKLDPKKPLSILVGDMPTVGQYAKNVTNTAFRVMKRVLPGPYTFIFQASAEVPKIMLRKRKTVGIRMPGNPIVLSLLSRLEVPLISTSIPSADDPYLNDPLEIEERYGERLELVIDGGVLSPDPSTIVDFSDGEPELLREGRGDVEALGLF